MYLAMNSIGQVSLFDTEPEWNEKWGLWYGQIRASWGQRLPSGFPPVKRGECIEVKLEPVKG